MSSEIPRVILDWLPTEKFMFSEVGFLLLDPQVPSASQFCPGNLFCPLYGRLD